MGHKTFPEPQPPSSQSPGQPPTPSHPIDPQERQRTSTAEPARDSREGRSRWYPSITHKRSRSGSTPPETRTPHDPPSLQQRTPTFPTTSAEASLTHAQNAVFNHSSVEVTIRTEGRVTTQIGGRFITRHAGESEPRPRRNSDARPPAPAPRRASVSSQTGPPVIPGVNTASSTSLVPNRLRRDPSRRPRILFYHSYEPHYGFTNFSAHKVKYKGKEYPTSEHLFQSLKFTHRPGLAEHIRICSTRPGEAFAEARRFAPEVRPDWIEDNISVMDTVIYHKFDQNRRLRRELLDTGDAELIENSDKDSFWGCGPDGKGRNELGKALERLRTQLRNEEKRR